MARFEQLSSTVVSLLADHIDTDQIIPARFLKVIDKEGLGQNLFADWRYLPDGSPNPDFVLNRPASAGAEILMAGENFGCGSSREHAPWALMGWGLRVVIASSFADIFKNNALKNGLLPVALSGPDHAALVSALQADPGLLVDVDLRDSSVKWPGVVAPAKFSVDSFARHCLLQGIDELGYILSFEERIAAFEQRGFTLPSAGVE